MNSKKRSLEDAEGEECRPCKSLKPSAPRILEQDGLFLEYHPRLFSRVDADALFSELEEQIEYFGEELSRVCVFGRWCQIPRRHAAYGDVGLAYRFSGNRFPARPWTPLLERIRAAVEETAEQRFNFVLVNRYADGNDRIGAHRDDEKELEEGAPIASLSLGRQRDFVLKRKGHTPVVIPLAHGSLLLMRHPTNKYWTHELPARKGIVGVRINLTFRKMKLDTQSTSNVKVI